jgi:intracellular septation protein
MKLLLDFFPIILFFVAFKIAGIYVATGVAIIATIAQIGWLRYSTGKVEPMQWASLVVIVLFGGATIVAQNDTFIKWKPTVLYWLMAGSLAAGQLFFKKNLLKSLMGSQLELPDTAWRVTNWSWVAFFSAMGVVNLWVAYHFDTNTWVNFKLFGGLGLMVLFILAQAVYLGRYVKAEEAGKP